MTKDKLKRQVELLHSDLEKCNKRCKRISKECGLPDNEIIQYAMEQTKEILNYIESLKDSKETTTL